MLRVSNDPVCSLCNEEEETASHIIFNCEALTCWIYTTLGYSETKKNLPKESLVKGLLSIAKLFAEE